MIQGTAYGVALNDRQHQTDLALAFSEKPYLKPPQAPVLYIKPRTCFSFGGAPTPVPAGLAQVEVAATLGLLIARDLTAVDAHEAAAAIAAACLAFDVTEPHASVYRPAIRQRCRDGFLPLGRFADLPKALGDIVTTVDGVEAHRWSLERLVRPVFELIADISQFMTLQSGDLLLVGLAADAPVAGVGQTLVATIDGLPSLTTTLVAETLS